MKIIWAMKAAHALDDAIGYLAKDSIQNAMKEYDKILNDVMTLKEFPEMGRILKNPLRVLQVGSSYRIFYTIDKEKQRIDIEFFQLTRQRLPAKNR